jgi:hypothetical protein
VISEAILSCSKRGMYGLRYVEFYSRVAFLINDSDAKCVQGLLPWGTRLVNKALMDTDEGGTSLSRNDKAQLWILGSGS